MKSNILKLTTQFFAVCPIGLEEVLKSELQELDITSISPTKGGIQFEADNLKAIEFILNTRVASKVYKQLFQFEVKTEKDLYFFAKEIKWKSLITPNETFKITPIQNRSKDGKKWSKFKSPIFLSQMLKDAIVDQMREKFKGERPTVEKDSPDLAFHLQVEPNINPHSQKEIVTISLDMTGRSLHERGYRQSRHFEAPLKENLAAGILKLAGYKNQAIIDPMCGSGTLVLEAMLMDADIPPSFIRIKDFLEDPSLKVWDFLEHTYFKKDPYLQKDTQKLLETHNKRAESGLKKLKTTKNKFIANDISNDSLKNFIMNLRNLGIANIINLTNQDATDYMIPSIPEGALLITNPPYGERMGEDIDLDDLYYKLGENLKHNFKGINAYILTGEPKLLKKISLRTSEKHILFNGGIETRLAKYELY